MGPLLDPKHHKHFGRISTLPQVVSSVSAIFYIARLGWWIIAASRRKRSCHCERRLSFQQLLKKILGSLCLHIYPRCQLVPAPLLSDVILQMALASLVLARASIRLYRIAFSQQISTMDVLIANLPPSRAWSLVNSLRLKGGPC